MFLTVEPGASPARPAEAATYINADHHRGGCDEIACSSLDRTYASAFMIRASTPGPQVRARYMQSFVKGLVRLAAEDRHAISAALEPGTLNAISVAPILGWLPFSVNVE